MDDNDVSMWVHQCNKCTTLVADVDNQGGYLCVGAGKYVEILCNFCSVLL